MEINYKINIRYGFNCTQLIPCSRFLPIPSFLVYLVNPNLLETWTFWRPANLALARRKASTANWIFSSCQQTGWEDHELGMTFRKLYCIYCKLPIVILVLYEILFAFLRVNTYTYIYIYISCCIARCVALYDSASARSGHERHSGDQVHGAYGYCGYTYNQDQLINLKSAHLPN